MSIQTGASPVSGRGAFMGDSTGVNQHGTRGIVAGNVCVEKKSAGLPGFCS
jgi:hypothetical protein